MTEEINFKAICNITTDTLNIPQGSLSLRSRKRPLQVARAIAAYIGRKEENIHRSVIGKVLNRNRSLVYHYEKKHKPSYRTCLVYRNTFNKVYKAYKDIDAEKEIFARGSHIKRHLLQQGVTEQPNSDVIIEVRSGEVKCKIKTSYFKFSEELEKIKQSLVNYHYTIRII